MIYYKYKKEKLEQTFTENKIFLMRIKECLNRNPDNEDEIINEATISYFNSFCEFIIDMCETFLVTTDNFIPNKSGPEIISLSSDFGFIEKNDALKLRNIVKLRNRYTHDYYERSKARVSILKLCNSEISSLELFLEISKEKIRLGIK
ncbi:MAG: HepT-like ribonuclease domain-containing protein [Clostridium sp.]